MRKSATWLACGLALAAVVVMSATRTADARPKYLAEFKGSYEKLAGEADKVKCNICHYGTEKKNRNDYAKALGEALGAKNVMEVDKIKEALKKTEKGKSSVEGKTFGDLINDGKLPGKAPE
jgi:hypothetical protein